MIINDQTNYTLTVKGEVRRIVSLVPSLTELLFDLNLGEKIVGRTKFCIHPGHAKHISSVGGTKNFKIEKIQELQPDLIIANKEENEEEGIIALRKMFPVYTSDINSLSDAYECIADIGNLTGRNFEAEDLIVQIKTEFKTIKPIEVQPSALYLIWNEPIMAAGTDTFISHLLQLAGFHNIVSEKRYPELTEQELIQANPAILMLSSEPFPFQQKHIARFRNLLPNTEILVVNGEIFSWYGSRLKLAPQYFQQLRSSLKSKV